MKYKITALRAFKEHTAQKGQLKILRYNNETKFEKITQKQKILHK